MMVSRRFLLAFSLLFHVCAFLFILYMVDVGSHNSKRGALNVFSLVTSPSSLRRSSLDSFLPVRGLLWGSGGYATNAFTQTASSSACLQQQAAACVGFGVDRMGRTGTSPLHCAVKVKGLPLKSIVGSANSSAADAQCTLSTGELVHELAAELQAKWPGQLTHRPRVNCSHGTYLFLHEHFIDGMGNSMWSRALATSLAMSLNASLIFRPFQANHEDPAVEMTTDRDVRLRFYEWEAPLEDWEACPSSSLVKQNQWKAAYTVNHAWSGDDPDFVNTRSYIRRVQYEQANMSRTSFMRQDLNHSVTYNYQWPGLPAQVFRVPRVDFIGPGMTIHIQKVDIPTGDYVNSLWTPGFAVAPVFEARYLAQNDHYRAQMHPEDLVDSEMSNIVGKRSWHASRIIHVAVPIRRGDVIDGRIGKVLVGNSDLRQRLMDDHAILECVTSFVNYVRNITISNTRELVASFSEEQYKFMGEVDTSMTGSDMLARMRFTVYSEGREGDFEDLIRALHETGLSREQIRLSLGGKASVISNLMTESDILFMSPSSYSYAAACFWNTESLKIGSGWMPTRFQGCHNFMYAPWKRSDPTTEQLFAVDAEHRHKRSFDLSQLPPQHWTIQDYKDLHARLLRLITRKQHQRLSFAPIMKDNWNRPPSRFDYTENQEA